MLPPIEIPTLLFWENGNTWYGSKGQARFFIQPVTHEAAHPGHRVLEGSADQSVEPYLFHRLFPP